MNNACLGGRAELLDWVNHILGLNYQKVEELANGAAFCQIFDCLYPGDIKMSRVDFDARSEPEMIANYKILQNVFEKQNISRSVPVESLIKKKPMASLEMLQWIKTYFDKNYAGGEYDGPSKRIEHKKKENGDTLKVKRPVPKPPAQTPSASSSLASARVPPSTSVRVHIPKQTPLPSRPRTNDEAARLAKEIEKMKAEMEQLRTDNSTLMEERDFYFAKLQKVEEICTPMEKEEFPKKILAVLYETDEEHGFLPPDECDI